MYTISIWNSRSSDPEICIYDDESPLNYCKLESATLSMEEGTAGSLTIKVPSTNMGYDLFETLTTVAIVRKREVNQSTGKEVDRVLFVGRLLELDLDFNNNKQIMFEGAYNYLMDTIQTPYHMKTNVTTWAEHLLQVHNDAVEASGELWKTVVKGYFDPNLNSGTYTDFYTDNESTLDMINNVCEGWKAHPIFTFATITDNGQDVPVLVLNLYKEYQMRSPLPQITFGENLLDYTREFRNEDVATVVIPVGRAYEDDERTAIEDIQHRVQDPNQWPEPECPEDLDMKMSIYSVNTINGDRDVHLYDPNQTNLDRYGYICKTVEFEDAESPSQLRELGLRYLQDQIWDKVTLSFSAFDLNIIHDNLNEIKIGELVHCYSWPHNLDHSFPCTAMQIDLMDISRNSYTLGYGKEQYLSDSSRKTDDKLRDMVMANHQREKLLKANLEGYTDDEIGYLYSDNNPHRFAELATVNEIDTTLQNRINSIVSGPDSVVETAKNNALSLLNIYDSERNPVNKGYVHFVKENVDYDPIDETSLDALITKIFTYITNATTKTNVTTVYNKIKDTYFDDKNYVIVAIQGPLPYNISISAIKNGQGLGVDNNPKILSDNVFAAPSGTSNRVECSATLVLFDNGASDIYVGGTGYFDAIQYRPGDYWSSGFPSSYPSYDAKKFPSPRTELFDVTGFRVYVNRDIYTSAGVLWKHSNLTKESVAPVEKYNDHINEIVISDELDYQSSTAGCWRWNKTGLYYLANGYNTNYIEHPEQTGYENQSNTLRLALTKDGQIVADHITAGKLDAGIIQTGILMAGPDRNNADFQIDMIDGIMKAKKGTLWFNNPTTNSGDRSNPDSAVREFAYFSNQPIGKYTDGRYMNVGGVASKEWMLIIGNGFGVDGFGKAVMREAIIGGTGGVFDVIARNEDYVKCVWYDGSSTDTLKYNITFNTDSYRPTFINDVSSNNAFKFRWAIGRFDETGDITYTDTVAGQTRTRKVKRLSAISSVFTFPPGWTSVTFENQSFTTTTTRVHGSGDISPYYPGELFPIWYKPDVDEIVQDWKVLEEDSYAETGYASGEDVPHYRGYSNRRYYNGSTNSQGEIHVGSGYLENGTTGQNRSFYLGGIKRSATIATENRDDWRLTVGSKFGVTEDGTLYAKGAVLTSIEAQGSYFAKLETQRLYCNQINSTNLKYKAAMDGTVYNMVFHITFTRLYTMTSQLKIEGVGVETDGVMDTTKNPFSYMPITPNMTVTCTAMFTYSNPDHPHTPDVDYVSTGRNVTFNIDKDLGTANNIVVIQGIDTHDWDEYNGDHTDHSWDFSKITELQFVMNNERSPEEAARPTFQMGSWSYTVVDHTKTEQGTGEHGEPITITYRELEGEMGLTRTDSDGYHDAIKFSQWLLGSQFGSVLEPIGTLYVNHLYYKDAQQYSSRIYKENITNLETKFDSFFDRLRPVSYNYKPGFYPVSVEGVPVRRTGFIMEEVKEAMDQSDILPTEFAGYSPSPDGNGGGLQYNNFIALNTWEIQRLKQKVAVLEMQLYEKGLIE